MPQQKPKPLDSSDIPELPIDSSLPPAHKLIDAFDHPAWYRPADSTDLDLFAMYKHRGGQLPIETPDTAWSASHSVRIEIRYDEHHDALRFNTDQHLDRSDCSPLPQNLSELRQTVRSEMQSRHHLYEAYRFRTLQDPSGNQFPTPLVMHLRETFGSLYHFHSLTHDDKLGVPGIGEDRLEAMCTNAEDMFVAPTWAVDCHCPNCETDYMDAFHASQERSLKTAKQLTYCPACLHDSIPKQMIAGPRDFNK